MGKKNPDKGSHHWPRDRTQIESAPDPPRRRRALAKRHSCMLAKPTQAVRLEGRCFATDFVSYFGIRGRTPLMRRRRHMIGESRHWPGADRAQDCLKC